MTTPIFKISATKKIHVDFKAKVAAQDYRKKFAQVLHGVTTPIFKISATKKIHVDFKAKVAAQDYRKKFAQVLHGARGNSDIKKFSY